MDDPYKILGVTPQSTDSEIKAAYRKLTQFYHPDRQTDSVMEEIANEKMAEVNTAYDKIMEMRKNGGGYSGGTSGGYGGQSSNIYSQARSYIQSGNYTAAESLLDQNRNDGSAEWNYLKGTVCLSRGWVNDAYSYFTKAVNLDPSNNEYRMAYNQLNARRNGQMNGNPYPNQNSSSNNTMNTLCDICQCLICMDCLCDCI